MDKTPKFLNVEDMLDYVPEDELVIALHLRSLVKETIPNAIEKLSYNVAFYKVNKGICFIWPASVLWGKRKTYEGVRFGLSKGYLIDDFENILDRGNRKQIYWIDFKTINEFKVHKTSLRKYLKQAVEIDISKAGKSRYFLNK
jgi:Domain of unknown function (DU1801)